MNYTNACT